MLADAINYAHSKGVVVVAATGNTGSNFVLCPARYPNVIAVAKTDNSNNWDGSNYGPEVDLAAPGALIYSTIIGGSYDYKSGSSMASGYVSGLAAILKGIPDNLSPDAIELQMESTALDIEFAGWDDYTGAGLIQMDAAIKLASPIENPDMDQSSTSGGSADIPGKSAPTNTPIPTRTVSPTLSAQEATATFTPETEPVENETGTPTSTPTVEVSEVETQGDSGFNTYILPCIGILLILLGVFLAWFFTRKNR